MKVINLLVFFCVLAVSLALYGFSRSRVYEYHTDYAYKLHAASIPLPPEVIKSLAGEFKGLAADYLLLEAASFIGSRQSFSARPEDWEAVARLLDQSSELDPYFKSTYRLAQATLPWYAKKYDQTLTILERSKKHLSWDWEPGFYIGFNYFYFLKDNLTASQKLMEAAKMPNAPPTLATLASQLASKAGHTRVAIDFLSAIYEKSDDEEIREILKQRILAFKGVEVLQAALERFQTRFGRIPHSLDELVETSILPEIPNNPYGRPFTLKDGQVDF